MSQPPALRSSVPPEAASRHFDPVLRPDLASLYIARAQRLRALAEGHELADYLRLAAATAQAQAGIAGSEARERTGVEPAAIAREGHWSRHLDTLLEHLASVAPGPVAPHLGELAALPLPARIGFGLALAEGRFEAVPAAIAPFLWAALSLEVALAARAAPLRASGPQEHAQCPICGTAPVASLIHTGDRQGLRYLHCALCECEWHMVRAKCSSCGDAGQLDYLSFESPEAVVRAESCGHCGGYLKVVSQERDPEAEVVADDLASLALDEAATAEGYGRTGFNPYALPG
ncbi:formate dehydrogenase accessory protein FdhE [Aureimonas populi]|uniref:Protein FdhE homolog n=1 Tax=Aureimonas populi TaxID=1701758 RepID=A0ABW5CLE3_9HYPH|nr:formate dehydrogenase accessory protein FdhE [Aureimonas populi]